MKRKREVEKEPEMRSATAELSVLAQFKPVDHAASDIPTKPFLSVCNLILQFLGTSQFLLVLRTVDRQDMFLLNEIGLVLFCCR